MSKKPDLTLYFLGASRSIRIAWLLEELKLDYNLVASERAPNGLAPPEYKKQIPNPLGKSPTIKDGDIVVTESGAIVEYLCENYDPSNRLIPTDPKLRAKTREWIAAAEGTFMLHGISILYGRWRIPEAAHSHLPEFEKNMSPNVHNDLNWLESELKSQKSKGEKFLVADHPTAADVMMQFSLRFTFARKLGVSNGEDGTWPEVEAWLKRTEETEAYLKAVERTGFTLFGGGFKT